MNKTSMHEKAFFGKSMAMLIVGSMFAMIAACSSTDSHAAGGVVQEPATFTLHGYVHLANQSVSGIRTVAIHVPDLSSQECIDAMAWYEAGANTGESTSNQGTIRAGIAKSILRCSPTVKYTTSNLF